MTFSGFPRLKKFIRGLGDLRLGTASRRTVPRGFD